MKSNMLMKKVFTLCVSLLVAGFTQAQSVFRENESWQDVKREAVEQKKLIFMDCYTVWCGPCKGLSEKVFPQPKVQQFLGEHFVACKYDMEKGEGAELYEKYKPYIPGFPTMLVINPDDETVVHKIAGYTEADALIQALQDGLDGKTLTAFQKRYDAGERSVAFMRDYCRALEVAYEEETKERVVRDFVESLPLDSLLNKDVFLMYQPYLDDVYSERYAFVLDNLSRYRSRLGMDRYDIESSLERAMFSAVGDFLKVTFEPIEPDSLDKLREKERVLKDLLERDVKGFANQYAKLVINDVRLTGDLVALDAILEADKALRATNDEISFRPKVYAYLIENADIDTQRSLVEKYLNIVQQKQDAEDKRSGGKISIFSGNDYDVLAIGYYRLGDKEKSGTCAKEFERRFKIKIDEMSTLSKNEKIQKELKDNYEQVVNELYDKIEMIRE